MLAEFRFIEQYKSMARDLDEGPDYLLGDFDQQVPQSRVHPQETDIKPQINFEHFDGQNYPFFQDMTDSISSNDSSSNSNSDNSADFGLVKAHNCSNNYYSSNINKALLHNVDQQFVSNTSLMTSSTPPSFSTFQLSPGHTTAATNTSTFTSATRSTSAPKINTRISETESSSNSFMPNFDILTDPDTSLRGFCSTEASPQYIDLDGQQGSMYNEYQSMPGQSKPGMIFEETKRLEEAAILMMDTIYKDCNSLKVPYDPMMWTPDHVRRWVSWVCHRNGVSDVSAHLSNSDGATLCSMSQDYFRFLCGDSGIKLSNELELWKAANTCFPNQTYITGSNEQGILPAQPSHTANSQNFNLATCVSPALSSCSSNHDSNTSISTHSDISDDENGSGYRMPHGSTPNRFREDNGYSKILHKIPTGRGHKQTIHLWQFLKELLLSTNVNYSDCIRWLDRKTGVFKIEDSKKVAKLWGERKNRPAMNYDKLSRSVRQYYKKGIIKKTEQSKRLVYQFCPGYN